MRLGLTDRKMWRAASETSQDGLLEERDGQLNMSVIGVKEGI